jgi:hypothetical protein
MNAGCVLEAVKIALPDQPHLLKSLLHRPFSAGHLLHPNSMAVEHLLAFGVAVAIHMYHLLVDAALSPPVDRVPLVLQPEKLGRSLGHYYLTTRH